MDLKSLAEKYCCDKLYSHSYIPFYERLFAGRTVKRLLEIGIGYEDLMTPFVPRYVHGASLRMWEEYFPDAEIYACDIRLDTLINEGRIHSMVCDQSKGDSLAAMVFEFTNGLQEGLDVIIDDGSHVAAHQIFTAKCLLGNKGVPPVLNPGGVYVIEDVQEPERVAPAVSGAIWRPPTREAMKRPDDCLVVIQL